MITPQIPITASGGFGRRRQLRMPPRALVRALPVSDAQTTATMSWRAARLARRARPARGAADRLAL
jgi:hypothetical protein